ncbi:D-alanyl-lipoteichoic acid biosynthesis protein DltD [Ornithinibacillus bavariensis]|uniref:D-alanyl-lipoteichoic acid biosynthesis protein DltD n=1 Tax=Ornithinibacillus bavariensis TaxID=545502 RepID=UPI001BB392CF|nr:D-alanyl-lipoteichoic acid biosynthesis protein DltD [Ornithinibacillus bavariensis]
MKKYSFVPLFIAVSLFLVFLFFPNRWLEYFISDKKVQQAATSLSPLMFQGDYLQGRMLADDKYFPIYGSSELSRFDPFHPSNFAEANNLDYTPFLIGRGGTQSLILFMDLASQAEQLKGKKIAFIVSPQWFITEGIDNAHFEPNYSMLKAYNLAFNDTIDPELKREAIRRILQFDVVKRDTILTTLYEYEISPSKEHHWKAKLVRPLAYMKKKLLEKKDLYYAAFGFPNRDHHQDNDLVRNKSWEELLEEASNYGKERANNNPYFMDNDYYNHNYAPIEAKLKGYKKNATFAGSLEYQDFQMVLDLFKDKGADPIFISLPINGLWYDYAGLPIEVRNEFYQSIVDQVETAGFPVADFSGHEYDPYFLKDPMHIAWKGWVYVDQALIEHWKR